MATPMSSISSNLDSTWGENDYLKYSKIFSSDIPIISPKPFSHRQIAVHYWIVFIFHVMPVHVLFSLRLSSGIEFLKEFFFLAFYVLYAIHNKFKQIPYNVCKCEGEHVFELSNKAKGFLIKL